MSCEVSVCLCDCLSREVIKSSPRSVTVLVTRCMFGIQSRCEDNLCMWCSSHVNLCEHKVCVGTSVSVRTGQQYGCRSPFFMLNILLSYMASVEDREA